jgi:hypothetical protein
MKSVTMTPVPFPDQDVLKMACSVATGAENGADAGQAHVNGLNERGPSQ